MIFITLYFSNYLISPKILIAPRLHSLFINAAIRVVTSSINRRRCKQSNDITAGVAPPFSVYYSTVTVKRRSINKCPLGGWGRRTPRCNQYERRMRESVQSWKFRLHRHLQKNKQLRSPRMFTPTILSAKWMSSVPPQAHNIITSSFRGSQLTIINRYIQRQIEPLKRVFFVDVFIVPFEKKKKKTVNMIH